jgi:hypothetical protein
MNTKQYLSFVRPVFNFVLILVLMFGQVHATSAIIYVN